MATVTAPPASCVAGEGTSCYSRVFAWGLDCEGERACEESRTPEERIAFAIMASMLVSPPVAAQPPARQDRPGSGTGGLAGVVAAGVTGLALGLTMGGRIARRRRLMTPDPGHEPIVLPTEPAQSDDVPNAMSIERRSWAVDVTVVQ